MHPFFHTSCYFNTLLKLAKTQIESLASSLFLIILFDRGECTETLRNRIRDLETECKKLTIDIKVKEDQIRDLEMKVQVRRKKQNVL